MREISKEQLSEMLDKHQKWLADEEGGERADLRNADLRNANLRNADLWNALGKLLSIGPIGSRHGITYAFWADNNIQIQCGCFRGTLDQWAEQCKAVHGDNEHGRAYSASVQFIRTFAEVYKWSDGE